VIGAGSESCSVVVTAAVVLGSSLLLSVKFTLICKACSVQ
jgi:hypothetical protein